ncbi:hypothetical protein CSB45_00825 [candidate division KSB3 bacterium]|uniref:Uncharacterized protein n=1 Tax=candidate division KSB3 bacterium TaxID=2044937 RepID=A0A2G6ECG3_9BACT|nr:MAG: hypothetical protein CSB45_00825 [candidate division KSB3 bacterium]
MRSLKGRRGIFGWILQVMEGIRTFVLNLLFWGLLAVAAFQFMPQKPNIKEGSVLSLTPGISIFPAGWKNGIPGPVILPLFK